MFFFCRSSVMAEAAQNRVQMAMKDFIDNIDKSKLRPVQKRMYLCNAECMDSAGSMEEVGSLQCPQTNLSHVRSRDVWRGALSRHRGHRATSSQSWSSSRPVCPGVSRSVRTTSRTRSGSTRRSRRSPSTGGSSSPVPLTAVTKISSNSRT